MNRRNFLILSGSSILMGLTGCANNIMGNMGLIPNNKNNNIKISQLPYKNILLKGDLYKVENGFIVSNNGNKFLDEEGDIQYVFNINNNWFYLIKIPRKDLFKIKTLPNKKTIKTFNAVAVLIFPESNNKTYIGVTLARYAVPVIDNVYEFNGKNFNLINKNVYVEGDKNDSVFIISTEKAIDIRNSKIYTTKQLENKFNIFVENFVGSINDKIILTYTNGIITGESYLGVYDASHDKLYTLLSKSYINNNPFQFLRSGHKIVLKYMINNKNHYIYLNNIIEIAGIDNSFKPIIVIRPHEYSDTEYLKSYTLDELNISLYERKTIIF